jgi:uncharacterized protein YbbK (DUF523 family)
MSGAPDPRAPAKILVSACLLGRPVRYDGTAKPVADDALETWRAEGRLIAICPETAGGLAVPRAPAEIAGGETGEAVLSGPGRVIDAAGDDVTAFFLAGAEAALALARAHGCRFALLKEGSPSCGANRICDGSFSGRKHRGGGVAAALLRRHGVEVFAETEIDALRARLALDGQR